MFKSKAIAVFVIFVLGVVYIGSNNVNNRQFDTEQNNIIINNE